MTTFRNLSRCTLVTAAALAALPALADEPATRPASQPAHAPTGHPGPHEMHSGHHHRFDNAEKWAERFDAKTRDAWQKPDAVINMLALKPGAHVIDVGSGTGYFAVRLARIVTDGHVFGVDIEPDMVRYLNERAQKESLPNLSSVVGRADGFDVGTPSDVILVVDTYHHIADRTAYFAAAKPQLNAGGVVAIVDFKATKTAHGPPPRMRLPAQKVIDEMGAAGYSLMVYDDATLPEQYVLIFRAR